MSGRGGVVTFFLFSLIPIILLLLILSDRLCFEASVDVDEVKGGLGDNDKGYTEDDGDWLIWAFRVEPKTLNPYSSNSDVYSRWITVPYIFEPLLVYDFDELVLKPWLAESFGVSSDGLEITFRLRDDIYFSDGLAVTADDVIFTYQTAVNPQVATANIADLLFCVEKAVKVNQREVKFVLKKPYFKALENLSFWSSGILPKHIYEFSDGREFNKRISKPVGSGPFVFEKWLTGREIVLRRNENYWFDKPKLEKIVFKFISNPLACVQSLRSHQVDIMIPEPDQFAELVNDERFNEEFYCLSYWNPGVPFYYIGWNQDTVFFRDKRVRLAMTHIINREQIVSHLLKGHGRIVTGPFYFDSPQNNPEIEPWPYDLDRARQLLNEAGWTDSDDDGVRDKDGVAFRFRFMYASESALYNRLARVLKDEAAKVGIDVIPEPLEWSILFSRLKSRQFDANIAGWAGQIQQDAYHLWHSSQIGNQGSNFVGFSNEKADAIIEKARRTLNETKRSALYHQLHKILHDEQPYTFLFTRPSYRFVDRRFKNVRIRRLGLKYWQWYVPKEQQRYN